MTKVEIDGKTYCVETLIYTVERLTKEVKASAEYHRLVLDNIQAEIEKRKEKEYLCFDDNDMDIYTTGLNDAIGIIDKYKTKPEDIEMRATEFLAEARACAER